MGLGDIIKKSAGLPPIDIEGDLDAWRNRVLETLMKTLVPLGLVPMLPSLLFGIYAHEWGMVVIDLLVYSTLVFVTFNPKVSPRLRGVALVTTIHVLGFGLLIASSRIGGATVWLVFAPFLATVLFDRTGMWASTFCNLVVVLGIALWASYTGPSMTPGKMHVADWLATGANFGFVGFAGSMIVGGVLAELRAAMERSREAYQALHESHGELRSVNVRLETETRALLAAEMERVAQGEMREELEIRLRESQKMEAIGRLAGGIAHDFNNMLTAILGFAHLTRERLEHDHQARDDVDEIRRAAERAQAMTRQLLALSRRQITQPHAIKPSVYLADLKMVLAQLVGAGVELELRLDEDTWAVLIDPGQLDQVVLNLVVNARDAMPDGGRLTISTSNETLDPTSRHLLTDGHPASGPYTVLRVRDNGQGMTPELKERIFEPFFTTKPRGTGTGLGLATVYGIVAQHGGFTEVDSALGEGTELRVYLPRTDVPVADEALIPEPPAYVNRGRVLLVEDEANVRRLTARVLKKAGYEMLDADSPTAALTCLEDCGWEIDLLVTDVVLPGMNGMQLYNKIRSRLPDLRVLYMSGYAEDAIARQGILPPGTDLLEKPFHPATLATRVAAALAR